MGARDTLLARHVEKGKFDVMEDSHVARNANVAGQSVSMLDPEHMTRGTSC